MAPFTTEIPHNLLALTQPSCPFSLPRGSRKMLPQPHSEQPVPGGSSPATSVSPRGPTWKKKPRTASPLGCPLASASVRYLTLMWTMCSWGKHGGAERGQLPPADPPSSRALAHRSPQPAWGGRTLSQPPPRKALPVPRALLQGSRSEDQSTPMKQTSFEGGGERGPVVPGRLPAAIHKFCSPLADN